MSENTTLNNRYFLESEIGRGGMGTVYKARDLQLDRAVAVKVLPYEFSRDEQFLARFKREILNTARLQHPNIVTIYDVGVDGNTNYYVMQYVDGEDLTSFMKSHNGMSVADVIRIIEPIASALDYAHASGIVHRDIKPENIMIDRRGVASLTDFGIAHSIEGTRMTTGLVGTPEYMSPEQAKGEEISGCSDQYSLAIVAYEMLTGVTPFRSDTNQPWAIVNKHISVPPPNPQTLRNDLPANAINSLMQALSKNPEQRFLSCSNFSLAMSGQVMTEKKSAKIKKTEKSEKKKPNTAFMVFFAIFVLMYGVWLVFSNKGEVSQSDQTVVTEEITQDVPMESPNSSSDPSASTAIGQPGSTDDETLLKKTVVEKVTPVNYKDIPWIIEEDNILGYAVECPADWKKEEFQVGKRHVAVYKSSVPDVTIQIDVMDGAQDKDPLESWQGLENRFISAYGNRYHRISMDYGTLGGERSGVWEFTIQKAKSKNIVLRKKDNGLSRYGSGYAMVCAAPVGIYNKYSDIFQHAFDSFKFTYYADTDSVVEDGGEGTEPTATQRY